MKMTGTQRIAAPRQRVWEALNDPEILRQSIPGCQTLEKESDDRLKATVAIKIGPMDARMSGAVTISDRNPPNSYTISGQGQGAAGMAKGDARVQLAEDGGATVLTYDVDAQVGGRMAQLGGPIIDATAKQIAANFFKRFGEIVAPESAPAGASASRAVAPARAPGAPLAPMQGSPLVWVLSIAVAAMAGFLFANGGSTGVGGLSLGLLIVVVAAAAFELGRRSAPPAVLDAALLKKLSELERKP